MSSSVALYERTRAKLFVKSPRSPVTSASSDASGALSSRWIRGAAAEPQQARLRRSASVDEHARADAERAEPAARLRLDDAADREPLRANAKRVADRELELRQQLRPHQDAEVLEQRVSKALAAGELHARRSTESRARPRAAPPSASCASPRPRRAPWSRFRPTSSARRAGRAQPLVDRAHRLRLRARGCW